MSTGNSYHIECGPNGLPIAFLHDEADSMEAFSGRLKDAVRETLKLAERYADQIGSLNVGGEQLACVIRGAHTLLGLSMAMDEEATALQEAGL